MKLRPPAVTAIAPPCILIGAGGHGRVVLALARAAGMDVHAVCDPMLSAAGHKVWEGLEVLAQDAAIEQMPPDGVLLLLGVGQLPTGTRREDIFSTWLRRGYRFPVLIHPHAWIAPGSRLAEGVQVMAGAVVQPDCSIGENTIVNTAASIDHDCMIGPHVHIAPGATLCGSVQIEDGAFIGAGAVVIQGVRVGAKALVSAGMTVLRDVEPGHKLTRTMP
jgi:sugar O-acyltransferase (sialic acid O-acetyltransferase NeuD family)